MITPETTRNGVISGGECHRCGGTYYVVWGLCEDCAAAEWPQYDA